MKRFLSALCLFFSLSHLGYSQDLGSANDYQALKAELKRLQGIIEANALQAEAATKALQTQISQGDAREAALHADFHFLKGSVFTKSGNNGMATCNLYCAGWAGDVGTGACLGGFTGDNQESVGCEKATGNRQITCICRRN